MSCNCPMLQKKRDKEKVTLWFCFPYLKPYTLNHTPCLFSYFSNNLTWVWKTACFEFGKYFFPIYNDIKDTIAAWDKFCLYIKFLLYFIHQTGGSGFIVSPGTIVNFNIHKLPPKIDKVHGKDETSFLSTIG